MRLFLVRHGQTTGDVEDRYGGDYDDHLTELGKDQARKLAGKLINKGIEVIFTSHRLRALETSEILSLALGLETKIIENFRERNRYGVMNGMVRSEADKKYPHLVALLKDTHITIEGGEDYISFGRRVSLALAAVKNSGFQTVAVVTHGGAFRFIFREILNLGETEVTDCAYAVLKLNDAEIQVEGLDGIETQI